MLHKKNLLAVLIVALFSFFVAGSAFADYDDNVTPDASQNAEFMKAGLAHAEEALAAAKAGDGAAAKTHTKAAIKELKSVYPDDTWAKSLNRAMGKIRVGGKKAGDGDLDAGIKMMESGIELLKTL